MTRKVARLTLVFSLTISITILSAISAEWASQNAPTSKLSQRVGWSHEPKEQKLNTGTSSDEAHPLCSLDNYWTHQKIEMSRTTDSTISPEEDCGKLLWVRFPIGGRYNPMHNTHDSLIPLILYLRLCGERYDRIQLVWPVSWRAERDSWLKNMLQVLLEQKWPQKFEWIPKASDRGCHREVTRMTTHYNIIQWDICEVLEEGKTRQTCYDELIATMQDINSSFRTWVSARSRTSGFFRILVYDRMQGRLNGRKWLNAADSIRELQKLPNVNVTYTNTFEIPTKEQCELFANMDILVTPHGAVEANLVCAQRNSAFVDIRKRCTSRHQDLGWHALHREALGLSFRDVPCEKAENRCHTARPEDILEAVKAVMHDMTTRQGG
eukprot:CAMPEP_0198724646 /NCGR_PEP_ID=MMETSP1475-20131203/2097_1 /TAXON_ID= ORGANISM="Unidentified sp., Strain CCMP1999" /NCGR_SAMPLE_ID=MMETSP1475 /ASSEMBLY_ACC=CAM_ASM_001111 /LENGTH=380 /DNA_ID=CAMNT_0044486233 /DNA_START=43 /DNA_END=1185 /DNA_ORIENTATION=+